MKTALHHICPPLLPVAVLLACGVWMGVFPVFSTGWVCLTGVIFTFLCVIFIFYRSSTFLKVCCLAAPLFGAVSMGQIERPTLPLDHISKFADGAGKVISGTIVSFARHSPGRMRVVLACREIAEKKSPPRSVSGRILVNIYRNGKGIDEKIPGFGDHIQFYSRLRSLRNFSNPGGYDYKARMRYAGIFGSAHTQVGKIKILPGGDTGIWALFFRRAEDIRLRFWRQTLILAGEGRAGAAGVLTALVTGKKEAVPAGIKEKFSQAGTSHLLAISGFHLSLIALGSYFLLNWALSRFYTWTVRGQARKAAGILTLFPLAAYALFTGFSPSTQRALIMVAAFMASLLGEKEKDPLNVLCLAAILILVVDPPALFSISFQLSFSAVFFIIIGFARVHQMGWVPKNKGVTWLWGMVLVTLFAGIGTGPLIARYFNMMSCVQIFSNLLLVPVIGFVCLPLGIAGLLLGGIWPGGSFWIMGRVLDVLGFSLEFIDYITAFDASWIRVVTPSNVELVLIYCFIAAVYLVVFIRKKNTFVFLAMVVAASTLSMGYRVKQRFFSGKLMVTVLDVGQGNAAVVRTPRGRTLLIDGGGFPGSSEFDTGRFIIGPYLWRQWVRTLDVVILTHPQADHMNGLVFIMENFRVNKWIKNRDENHTRAYRKLLAAARKKNIPVDFSGPQGLDMDYDNTRIHILPNPGGELDLNNNSLICRLVHGDFSMLFPGDIEVEREQLMAGSGNILPATTILLAPHHGSKSSSSKIFLDQLNAQGVIISSGHKNRYGFPNAQVLNRYRNRGMKIFRTDLQGAVTVLSSGTGYEIITHRKN